MGNFSEYASTRELIAAWEKEDAPRPLREATQAELDHLFGRKPQIDPYAGNDEYGQF